ncbi:hypothetical protein ACWDTT_10640 [Streptosporangium sandarakinum]
MSDPTSTSPLSPAPRFPERLTSVFERKNAPFAPGGKGPLRFEEGIATDTDVPSDFTTGIMQGYQTAPGRPNHNMKVDTKTPGETTRQRAHVGSSSWIEAPTFLGEFAFGTDTDKAAEVYQTVRRSGHHYTRYNPARVDE